MKNLKRILSLALASVMVVGMMVVGAGAAFNDQADIDHATAVNTLYALGVISGKEGNNFDPDGLLTRAEMATVIAVIRNKGVAPKFGTKPTPTYSDIDNHWAESYIEYCNSFGIVGGVGGGKFDPEGKLTSTQAARMLLNAMGYGMEDPSNWALLTEVQARDEGVDLYAGIDEEIADPTNDFITRDQMAQMAYNALNGNMADAEVTTVTYYTLSVKSATATTVTNLQAMRFDSAADAAAVASSYNLKTDGGAESYTISKVDNDTTETLGGKYLSLDDDATGVMTAVKYNKTSKKYETSISGMATVKAEADFSALIGQNVKVLTNTRNGKVYGITANKGGVVFDGVIGDLPTAGATDKKIKVNGVTYDLGDTANTIKMIAVGGAADANVLSSNSINDEFTMKGIDTTGNGKVDHIYYMPVYLRQVTNVSATNITLNANVGTSTANQKVADVVAYDGIAKGDYVLAYAAANNVSGKLELVEATTVTGTVAGTRGGDLLVGGEWISAAAGKMSTPTIKVDDDVELVMVNGYYGAVKKGETAANTDMLFVTKVASKGNGLDAATYQARVVTTEGKYRDIDIKGNGSGLAGNWCTYTEKDNVFTLTALDLSDADKAAASAKKVGYDNAYAKAWMDAEGDQAFKSNSTKLNMADDAVVVFLHDVEGADQATTSPVTKSDLASGVGDTANAMALAKLELVSGKTVKALKNDLGSASADLNVAFTETVNGIEYVKFAFIVDKIDNLPGTSGTENWGWVVSVPYTAKDGITYKIWNGEDTVTVTDTGSKANTVAIGDFIKYEDLGDGKIESAVNTGALVKVDPTTEAHAITGYNAVDGIILLDGKTGVSNNKKITETTRIMYIDVANGEGVVSGTIELADQSAVAGLYTANAYVQDDGSGNITLLVIDVSKNINEKEWNVANTSVVTANKVTTGSSLDIKTSTYADKKVLEFGTGVTVAGLSSQAAITDIVAFVFNGRVIETTPTATDKQNYTLTITASNGAIVYVETAEAADAQTDNYHFFYVDKTGAHLADKALEGKGAIMKSGEYYSFTIVGADRETYASGSFKLN